MRRVAFIGTGAIGNPMAARLVWAGFNLTVYDVRKEAMKSLLDIGAEGAENLRACINNDLIIIMVANDKQVEDVIFGKEGILENLPDDAHPIIAVMSTVAPDTVKRIGEKCLAMGVPIIDAPVSGSHIAAATGNLSVMVGGAVDIFEQVKPVLSAIGRNIYHVGDLGAGETLKLVNNVLGVSNIFLTVEAIAIGVRNGIPIETLIPIIERSSGSNFYIKNWEIGKAFFSDFSRNLDTARSNLSLCIKDLEHALDLAGCPLESPLLTTILNVLKEMRPSDILVRFSKALS
jgi:3-hydroxyisobutyrate dehydrogenase-like beta-hydroxyacid dehydrogenase